ncbi:hypothetical protein WR25_08244 [Diploscapter pachys]|uniref:AB hydrolase-1 domain-containing protein n=1 Tax=Diploscapter pachys TaxID=2018661 RepID=A0A2A2LHL5_9BILA|nr:hypothetical protein WR25_08244 [Diploscapter pachys]
MGLIGEIIQSTYVRCQQILWTTLTIFKLAFDRLRYGGSSGIRYEKPRCLEGWQESYIMLSQVQLHYVETGPKDGPLMLFIHGFPEFWYSWRFQLKHFADKYRCIAIDQRGYNLSDKPKDMMDYRTDFMVNDVKDVIERLGYKKAILVSHDWGGIVAWRVAFIYPELVDKMIVLNCPHPAGFREIMVNFSKQRLNSWYIYMFRTPYIPEAAMRAQDYKMLESSFRGKKGGLKNPKNFTDEDLQAWKHVFSQEGALTPPINYYRCLWHSPLPKRSETYINAKTLIIWGTEDPFLIPECAEYSAKYCHDVQVVKIEGASHWVMQDEPEKVNKAMRDFLESNDPQPNSEAVVPESERGMTTQRSESNSKL